MKNIVLRLAAFLTLIPHAALADLGGGGFRAFRRIEGRSGDLSGMVMFGLATFGIAGLAAAIAHFITASKSQNPLVKSAQRGEATGLLLGALTLLVMPFFLAASGEASLMLLVSGVAQMVFFTRRGKRLKKEVAEQKKGLK